ncbi:MAG: SDR family NAD(P)-dependent oxidoreductase [Pseudomonadota bacterium]|nr:SDR family NAD(P)-dependent oxidoreductase [Pseudomonadota bacterium]
MNSTGQVVAITGAAGNLGRAAAAAFARHGAQLVLIDMSMEHLKSAYPEQRADRLLLAADLTAEESVKTAATSAFEKFNKVDVLCNIAGGFHYGEPVHKMGVDVLRRMVDLNAVTMLNAVKFVVPRMIEAGSGTVINIGAAAHVHGHAHMSAYAVGKGAVLRLTESMAEELQDTGVNVFCVMPTLIDTPQNRHDMPTADFSTWTPPDDIAGLMLLLTEPAAALMSGCSIPLKGRLKRRTRPG